MNRTTLSHTADASTTTPASGPYAERGALVDRTPAHQIAGHTEPSSDALRTTGSDALRHLLHDTEEAAQQRWDAVKHRSERARDATTHYVQQHPLASVLVAAAAGAVVAGLVSLVGRHAGGGR